MLYMLVEHYTSGPTPVYERAAEQGRMLPPGLHYIDSWVVAAEPFDHCFQLMETDEPSLFGEWLSRWSDLATFELFPVMTSAEAAQRVSIQWNGGTPSSDHE